ncbi:MAG TPA: prolipoprotein diacylglyceryl transferase family protein [Gemmata sp.]|jgi:prolipoprotein diacylglyceryltransferase|nr:prolipoprotein diacylglyceryl transferase family protein [Gemmata sp.]
MQQVLFTIPFIKNSFMPDGIPVYGFGAMLFVTFILVTLWGTERSKPIGMPAVRFQDFTIWVFISGLIGARVLYMIQYANQFPDHSILGMISAFFKIWEGGIIFYGSALGGAIGYGLFYWFVMRRINVSGWQLADAVAPLLALGLAIGRIGCYLNGCCWGQVACEQCAMIPLGAAHFPLLPAHARGQLVTEQYLQTSTGFAIRSHDRTNRHEDPRAEITIVEPGSPAAKAGLLPGDRVVKVNGKPNSILVDLVGTEEQSKAAIGGIKEVGGRVKGTSQGRTRVEFDTLPAYIKGQEAALNVAPGIELYPADYLEELTRDWPRGKAALTLVVEREGREINLPPFTPQTVGLYPTQLYETVSMVLLIFLLLAYFPYRRHDGQLIVILMVGYAVHRFINESLRIEPTVGLGLTLSQWGSVVIFVAAVGIEIYLWCAMPSRWNGNDPSKPTTPPMPQQTQ